MVGSNEYTTMKGTQEVNVSEESVTPVESSHNLEEQQKFSTWQMVKDYKVAVLWSGFFALAAVNWGMDIQVGKCSRSPRISSWLNNF